MTAQDELARTVRSVLDGAGTITEKKMFGGIGFMLDGNLVAGVSARGLLVRVGTQGQDDVLRLPGARLMEMRGKVMSGYVRIDPAAATNTQVQTGMRAALAFVRTLPAKAAKPATATIRRVKKSDVRA
jgi:TfoX/Sxy family transcriptional regulator of competence genes